MAIIVKAVFGGHLGALVKSPGTVHGVLSDCSHHHTVSCTRLGTVPEGRQDVQSLDRPTERGTGTHTGPTNTTQGQ